MKKIFVLITATALLLAGCFGGGGSKDAGSASGAGGKSTPAAGGSKSAGEDETVLSLEDKLWQMFYVAPEAISGGGNETVLSREFVENAKKYKVGGIILFSGNAQEKVQLMKLLGELSVSFEIPVFLGVDEEGGIVSRLSDTCGVTDNGNMSEVESVSQAKKIGERLGLELSGLGFNMDFAPVADVLVNPNNFEIGVRSFGSDAVDVAAKVAAEVEGMKNRGISAVLKHFPGHGSTEANSHDGMSVSERTLDQLREEEFLPFIKGIEKGADFVMVSHMSLPNVVGDDTPCTLSPAVINGLLRDELKYDGIVITDAMNMGAVTSRYGAGEACVMAVEAGADMLLMPDDLEAAHAALLEAVQSGRISEERIDESIERIFTVKRRMGLIK